MMKTALSIAQSVRRRLNYSVPSSLISLTDPDELQQREVLYAVCEELRQARCWAQQKRRHTFDTVNGVSSYQLPKDFYSPLLGTHFNQDDVNPLYGPMSDEAFTWMLFGETPSLENYSYRLFGPDQNPNSAGGQFVVNPTPTSAQTLSFEYVSRNLFMPKNWLPSTAYTSGTYVNANGNIYLCDTNGTSSTTAPTGTTANITDGTTQWDYVSDPYEEIIADTDLCIFDADLVKLGLRAKWIEEQGGDYQNALFEYTSKIDQAVGRMKGAYVGSMVRTANGPQYRVPYKSWSF